MINVLLFTVNEYQGGVTTFVNQLFDNRNIFEQSGITLKVATFEDNPVKNFYPKTTEFLKLRKTDVYKTKDVYSNNKILNRVLRIFDKICWKLKIPCVYWENKKEIKKYLNENNFDCVIGNSGGYCHSLLSQFLNECKINGVKNRIFLAHNYPTIPKRTINNILKRLFFDIEIRAVATRILTVSEFCAERIKRTFFLKHDISVIYNGIEVHHNELSLKQKSEILIGSSIEKKPDVFVFGMVANFLPEKGQLYFLQALKKLIDNGKNIIGIIIGKNYDMTYYEECHEFIDDNNINENVFIKTNIFNASDYMDVFDVLCMPSIDVESFGLVALEAMIYHVPTVAFKTGGIPEVVSDGKSGFVVEKNVNAMAEAMSLLYDDCLLYKKMSDEAYERWKNNFTSEMMCQKYIEYIKNLV